MTSAQRAKLKDQTEKHIEWVDEYIRYFIQTFDYSPLDDLADTAGKPQKLYAACVDYLYEIETALEEANARFEKRRKSITFE